jgi:lysophospholipase L1-like esterase
MKRSLPKINMLALAAIMVCSHSHWLLSQTTSGDVISIAPDPRNISKLAQKIHNGETVRAGFLGGSITQGAGATNHGRSYYWLTRERLTKFIQSFSGSQPEFILAAVGGTGTTYGAYRAGVQLFEKGVDLLVIEFAVNDFKNPAALDGMEGIVRQALKSNPDMAVVLFHTTNLAMLEECYQKNDPPPSVVAFNKVAQHYSLAVVHSGPLVHALFKEGKSSPEAFFKDGTHPTDEGHAFYSKILSEALIAALEKKDFPAAVHSSLPPPLGSGLFEHARLLPVVPLEKSDDWEEQKPAFYTYLGSWKTASEKATMSFIVRGAKIHLLCGKTSRLRVSSDELGEQVLAPRNRPGGIPTLQLLHDGFENREFRITVAVLPDEFGNVEAELAGVASIILPE